MINNSQSKRSAEALKDIQAQGVIECPDRGGNAK
jgi:hypothetical protein